MNLKSLMQIVFPFSKSIIEQTPPAPQQNLIRLSKWISQKSLCSKKDAEQFINLGLVRVDGKRVYHNMLVPEQAKMKAFTQFGVQEQRPVTRLWMMNKPRGYICTHRDPQNRPNVYKLLPPFFKTFGHIVSVGRLDFNSQGLLLLTNDVQLKNLLQNPQANLQRYYRVKVHGRVTPEKLQKMSRVLTIKGKEYGPLQVKVDRALTTNVWINVWMKTGKNRQIRRIMQSCDLQVNKLIREAYGYYKIGNLQHGEVKEIAISEGLAKRIKIEKARSISKNAKSLIEIDIRESAIKIAEAEKKIMLEMQAKNKAAFPNKQQSLKKIENKSNSKKQDDSQDSQDQD